MSRTTRVLLSLRHFAVTWGLPDDFGGMTNVIFRRSAGFASVGAPVTVLTFDDRLDTVDAVARLRQRGVVAPGVDVLHLWDWLAANPLRPTARTEDLPFDPLPAENSDGTDAAGGTNATADPDGTDARIVAITDAHGGVRRRERRAPDGSVLQVDRYRPDGSLLASDLRDTDERGRPGGRSVVVCGPDGAPVRGWTTIWGLYRHWIDVLTARKPSMVVVDSKTAARFMHGYRRDHVAVVHVVHSAHRSGDGDAGRALKASRRSTLEHAEEFDAVVALTERQRLELVADVSPAAHIVAVPNAGAFDALSDAPVERDADSGVVLASLTSRKRVEHAIVAAARAGARLDVYGDGPERAALQQQVAGLDARAAVSLRGHRPDASLAFRDASFSLLTSTSEGAPLVLVESMAAGCIPIAYDIRYGPRDIITDGVDGFVVAPGDPDAMAATIADFVALPERKRRRMRRAARRSASRYGQSRVTDQWAALFDDIVRRRWPVPATERVRRRARSGVRVVRSRMRGMRRRLR